MILAIDAGNTAIKWGMHDGSEWQSQGSAIHSELVHVAKIWRTFATPDHIIISNVAGELVRSELALLLSPWHREPNWLVAKSRECGVVNGYAIPAQLGSDRWASLIAAKAIYDGSCLVVTVGTAMTVDALTEDGKFLGGIIVPGPQLMLDALAGKTAGVRPQQRGVFARFPDNTADAAFSGSLQALTGGIERMRSSMVDTRQQEPFVILSGGGSSVLQPLLNMPFQVVDNLVLEGLIRIAQQ